MWLSLNLLLFCPSTVMRLACSQEQTRGQQNSARSTGDVACGVLGKATKTCHWYVMRWSYSKHNQPLSSLPWLCLGTKQSIFVSLSLADASSSVGLKINPLRLCIFFLWSFSLWLPCFYEYDLDPRSNVDFKPRNQLPVSLFVLLALHLVSCQLEASVLNSYSARPCRAVCL